MQSDIDVLVTFTKTPAAAARPHLVRGRFGLTARRDSIDAVEDILRNLRLAREFVGDALTVDELEGDSKTLYSLVRALEVVGDATKRVGSRAELHGLPEELAASKKVAISGAHGVVIGEILMLFLGV